MLHIGNLIKDTFDNQPKHHSVKWFADQINCERGNIYRIFKKNNIDIHLLYSISKALDHDFFADISDHLK